MTLATILFLLGILIIISKCDPFLVSKTPQRGPPQGQAPTVPLLAFHQTLTSCLLVLPISLPTGKKVKCRKADSRSERSGRSGERGKRGGAVREGLRACLVFYVKPAAIEPLYAFLSIFASIAPHASPVSQSFPPQVRVRKCVVLEGGQVGAERGVIRRGISLEIPKNGATNPVDGHRKFSRN